MSRQDLALGYGDLERMGFNPKFIEDYQGIKRELVPQRGADTNPNGIYVANLNSLYFDTTTPSLWIGIAGTDNQWIKIP
jgi:hypothetical protein